MIRIPPRLTPSLRRPSNLPKSTASANNISCFWVEGKDDLKSSVVGIIKQVGDLLGENLSFDKVHMIYYTSLAHGGGSVVAQFGFLGGELGSLAAGKGIG
jgi:hypothetical protein